MERDIQLLESIATVKIGETFCFHYLEGAPLPRTSWTTSFYRHYNCENRETMLDMLEQLIDRIENRDYVMEDIRNKELVASLLGAAGGLRNLALSYEDDPQTNDSINKLAARFAEVRRRLDLELVNGVSITATKIDSTVQETKVQNESSHNLEQRDIVSPGSELQEIKRAPKRKKELQVKDVGIKSSDLEKRTQIRNVTRDKCQISKRDQSCNK